MFPLWRCGILVRRMTSTEATIHGESSYSQGRPQRKSSVRWRLPRPSSSTSWIAPRMISADTTCSRTAPFNPNSGPQTQQNQAACCWKLLCCIGICCIAIVTSTPHQNQRTTWHSIPFLPSSNTIHPSQPHSRVNSSCLTWKSLSVNLHLCFQLLPPSKQNTITICLKILQWGGFPGGPVVGSPLYNAGDTVQSLVWEHLMLWNCWAYVTTTEAHALGSMLCSKETTSVRRSSQSNWEWPAPAAKERSPHTAAKTQHSQYTWENKTLQCFPLSSR